MTKTHWKKLINPDYLGAYSLPEGQDLTVTIKNVTRGTVKGEGGRGEECTIANLENQKPFILNRTNQKSIERLYGPYIEDWAGKQVTLYASKTKLKGELVECVRIRPSVAEVIKPALEESRFINAIKAIKGGSYTVQQLNDTYELTGEQQTRLRTELDNNG